MRDKKTFHGPTYRAQIWIFDYSDSQGILASWKNKPTSFAVSRLGQQYPRSASFSSAGDQVYYGTNYQQAVKCASAIVHKDISGELPKEWKRYENQTAL